jgi:RNA polymerase sigma factor (sigma-70 family)
MINIEEHIPWVLKVSSPYAKAARVPVRDSEVFADGCLGLAKAAEAFDPDRGVNFLTFASHYVRGEILDGIRRRRTVKKFSDGTIVRNTQTGDMAGQEKDHGLPVLQSAVQLEEAERLRKAITRLPDEVREIITMRLDGASILVIGSHFGYSRQRADVVLKNAISQLRQEYFANVK